ncbi:helix-turn-helix transcriptional regulator [Paraburkholderia sp. USG1]|uniref:helix-turn-helix transcriptional regulator n=1 Tax=Paraburkholderia sp. USG1 TaxID=2952268 RepID=UPI0028563056|nr:helix-turn-helix transcriptional regulator [Paraburkholderia sp. USG1]MDR8400085.1 helix-turn-helix transcriptional regulator [Paraburkholderia sp. USG1]
MDARQLVVSIRKQGLTQEQIAERTGLSQGAVSHIETGRRKNVFATTKERLEKLHTELAVGAAPAEAA